jgi:hypothetical protein
LEKSQQHSMSFVRSMSSFYIAYVALCLLTATGDATV